MTSKHTSDVKITEDEAAVYDRQIRVWGIEAQKRSEFSFSALFPSIASFALFAHTFGILLDHSLRASKVLVVGLGSFGAELCKNIVLAGIGLTIF